MELIGKILAARYEVMEKIGEGGMATVFKARDNLLNRYVAVKILKGEYAKDEVFVKRFRTEAQSAASLIHPNIVSVFDVGEDKGINYIVMELLESKTLKDYIEAKGALSSELTLKVAAQIASALEAAHKANIVHRDIKPQNVLLNQSMIAKVTDFGIAKVQNATSQTITSFGNTMGSVHYFSPEHAKGGYTDAKSDLYSLGVVMYEMATGKLPFDAESAVSVALQHIQDDPVPPIELNPRVSPALNDIILKAMEKSTAKRYQTATEVLTDISIALTMPSGTSLSTRPSSSIEAGATQVIPVIGEDQLKGSIPNVRTRQSSSRSAYVPQRESVTDKKEEVEETETVKPMNKKQKVVIGSLIAVFAIVMMCVFGYYIGKIVDKDKVTEVEIPTLVGFNAEEMKAKYEALGFEIVQTSVEYSADVEEGKIISQDPAPGSKTPNKKITITVSKGIKLVEVKDQTGKDIKVAKYELENTSGFIVEQIDEISETVAKGIVISHEYIGEKRPYGSIIKVKVSSGDGKKVILMPNVIGKTQAEAKATLEAEGLKVDVKTGEDENKSNGVIIAQSYPQNSSLKEGDLVTLTVNKRIISKTVTVSGIPDGTSQSSISVSVSVDGGASNKTQFNFDEDSNSLSFTINGYEKLNYTVSVNGNIIKSGEENF